MDLEKANPPIVEQLIIIDNTNNSIELLSRMNTLYRTRKILLRLLSIMFIFSFFYLIFVSLTCIIYTYSWLCRYYSYNYEFIWELISVIYDGLWLLVAYRYYARGLTFFAWISTIFLLIFGILLIIAILTLLQTITYARMIATHILLASISSIFICFITSILQTIIVLYSFKLSKLISEIDKSIYC